MDNLALDIKFETIMINAGLRDKDESWALAFYRGWLSGGNTMCYDMWKNYFSVRREWKATFGHA